MFCWEYLSILDIVSAFLDLRDDLERRLNATFCPRLRMPSSHLGSREDQHTYSSEGTSTSVGSITCRTSLHEELADPERTIAEATVEANSRRLTPCTVLHLASGSILGNMRIYLW